MAETDDSAALLARLRVLVDRCPGCCAPAGVYCSKHRPVYDAFVELRAAEVEARPARAGGGRGVRLGDLRGSDERGAGW